LFGLAVEHDAIFKIAKTESLVIHDDATQAFGAVQKGKRIGSFGDTTATSFFLAKPLGCYGDGGAVVTNDGDMPKLSRRPV
jgi:dTDP-4-amino-4,6-dideoxygalactose transaminase